MSTTLSCWNLTICSPIWAVSSQIEPPLAVELHWVLTGFAVGIVVTCLIVAALIRVIGDKTADSPKTGQATVLEPTPQRTAKKTTALAETPTPAEKEVALTPPSTATTSDVSQVEELITAQAVPPAASITDLQVKPDRVTTGSIVDISATITNNSQTTIQQKVELKINDEVTSSQEITLAAGESQEVTFVTTAGSPGDYQVAIDGLTGKFSVMPTAGERIPPAIPKATAEYQAAADSLAAKPDAIPTAEEKPPETEPLTIRLPRLRLPKLKLPGIFRAPEAEEIVPPPISITDLQIMPNRVAPNSSVGIIAIITNNSQATIEHKVELKINDQVKTFLEITLTPGESQEVTFVTTAGPPGDYQVAIDGLTGKLSVISTAGESASPVTSQVPDEYQAPTDSPAVKPGAIPTAEEKPPEVKPPAIRLPRLRLPKLNLASIFRAPKAEEIVPPALSITDLQIMPDRVTPASSVGIGVTVTNNSQYIVQHKVELKINDQFKTSEDVILAPGESQEVTFVTTASSPGEYQVAIDGLTSKFSVVPTAGMAG